MSGPTVPGAVAHILPNGLAAIPQGAPPAVSRDDRRPQPDHPLPTQLGGGHTPVSMKVPARGGGLPARAGAAPTGRGTCHASRLCPTPPPQIWAALLGVAETTEFVHCRTPGAISRTARGFSFWAIPAANAFQESACSTCKSWRGQLTVVVLASGPIRSKRPTREGFTSPPPGYASVREGLANNPSADSARPDSARWSGARRAADLRAVRQDRDADEERGEHRRRGYGRPRRGQQPPHYGGAFRCLPRWK